MKRAWSWLKDKRWYVLALYCVMYGVAVLVWTADSNADYVLAGASISAGVMLSMLEFVSRLQQRTIKHYEDICDIYATACLHYQSQQPFSAIEDTWPRG